MAHTLPVIPPDADPNKIAKGSGGEGRVFYWIPFTVVNLVSLILLLAPIFEPEHTRAHRALVLLVWVTGMWVLEAMPFFVTSLSILPFVIWLKVPLSL